VNSQLLHRWSLLRALLAILLPAMSCPASADSLSYTPGLAFLETRDAASVIRAGVSLPTVSAKFKETLEAAAATSKDLRVQITKVDLRTIGDGQNTLEFSAGFKATYKPLGLKLKCTNLLLQVTVPAVAVVDKPDRLTVLKLHHQTDCEAPGLPGDLVADAEQEITLAIDKGLADAVKSVRGQLYAAIGLDESGQPIPGDTAGDALRAELTGTWIQAGGCERFSVPFYCFTIALPAGATSKIRDTVIGLAPKGSGNHDVGPQLTAALSAIQKSAILPRKLSSRFANYRFPASIYKGKPDEGDLTLSGGLICAANDDEGCLMVRRAQGKSGQIWRSPDLPDSPSSPSKSDFSGDQFKGVALLGAFGAPSDKQVLQNWLNYILTTKATLPAGGGAGSAEVYRTCAREQDYACVLGSEEWATLSMLARRHSLAGVPSFPDTSPEGSPYGWTPEVLEYSALFNKIGYRTHLIGVQLLLLQKLQVAHPSIRRAAAILAARQPSNPFYLYLLHGKDAEAAKLALGMCDINTLRKIKDKHSWVWQHDTARRKWLDDPMIWDCHFMLKLLE
jgi:hypothetical protein